MTTGDGEPIGGLQRPDGQVTRGTRPDYTLRLRNGFVAHALPLKGRRVLDIGCAEGVWSLHLAEDAAEVVGVDHHPPRLAKARANAQAVGKNNVRFVEGDIREPGFLESLGRFDLIVAWGLLHRIPDVFAFFHAIAEAGDAISLEWSSLLVPHLERLSLAYHPAHIDDLDPWNLPGTETETGRQKAAAAQQQKIHGESSFWHPTPGAIRGMARRVGFGTSRVLGYGELLRPADQVLAHHYPGGVQDLVSQGDDNRLPIARVHMLAQGPAGPFDLSTQLAPTFTLPRWDAALIDRAQKALGRAT